MISTTLLSSSAYADGPERLLEFRNERGWERRGTTDFPYGRLLTGVVLSDR